MNPLCLVESEDLRRGLEAALYGVGVVNVRVTASWDAFMQAILADRPSFVVLERDALYGEDGNQLVAADWALRAMLIPRIVALGPGQEQERYALEVTTEFEHFVVSPFAQDELVEAISGALGHRDWLQSQELPPVFEADFGDSTEAQTGKHATLRPTENPLFVLRDEAMRARADQPTLEVPQVDEEEDDAWPPSGADAHEVPFATGEEEPVDPNAISAFPFGDDVPVQEEGLSPDAYEALIEEHYAGGADNPFARRAPASDTDTRRSTTPTGMRGLVDEERSRADHVVELDDDDEGVGVPGRPVVDAEPLTDEPSSPVIVAFSPTKEATQGHESPRAAAPAAPPAAATPMAGAPPAATAPATAPAATAPPAAKPAESGAPPSAPQGPTGVQIPLAPLPRGSLESASVPEVIYACAVTGATGRLVLQQGGLRREVTFLNGLPGRIDATQTQDELGRLWSAFLWTTGEYAFEATPVAKVGFMPYGDVLEFLYRGMERYLGMNELATRLAARMRSFPVHTTIFARMEAAGAVPQVGTVLRRVDGQRTFEQGIVGLGVDPETAIRAVYFGALTGLVVFADRPTAAPVDAALVRTEADAANRSGGAGASAARAPERTTARVAVSPEHEAAFAVLREMKGRMQKGTAWDVLGLGPDAGDEKVSSRFQELVRTFHPDRFVGAGNPELHQLAHEVFLGIRTAYQAVRSGQAGAHRPGGVSPVAGSSAVRSGGVTGGNPASRTTTTTGENAAVGGTQGTRVNDALERLRRATGQHQAVPAAGSGGDFASRPVTNPSIRRATTQPISIDQVVRNAIRAIEGDAIQKASELMKSGRARGGTHPLVPVIDAYIAYRQDEISARKALSVLEEQAEALESDPWRSTAYLFAAHVQRLEEELESAQKLYQKAMEKDRSNADAARWIRYLRARAEKEKSSGGFLNKLLNTKITLSGKPK